MNYLLSQFFYVIYSSILAIFIGFLLPSVIMYILNIARTIKKMTVNELRDFIFEKYYRRIGFSKENT